MGLGRTFPVTRAQARFGPLLAGSARNEPRSARRSRVAALAIGLGILLAGFPAAAQSFAVLWWDATPEFGAQAPNALRQEMSDFLQPGASESRPVIARPDLCQRIGIVPLFGARFKT